LMFKGGTGLNTCAPMSFDRSDDRIISIHFAPVSPKRLNSVLETLPPLADQVRQETGQRAAGTGDGSSSRVA
jgi:hypothetical protein